MPDPFSTLPLPLPLFILTNLPDLGILYCCLLASPAASYFFSHYYYEITESILASYIPEVQQLLRTIICIRSQPSYVRAQCNSLDDFKAFWATWVLAEDVGAVSRHSNEVTRVGAVRSLTKTANQVQALCTAFFKTYFARLN